MNDRQRRADTSSLIEKVLELASESASLDEAAKDLVLEALDAPQALKGQPDVTTAEPQPVPAFLTSIYVRGFRGIGQSAKLSLRPGPGLTVVCGRNGSGKSSFAEALELAITGNTYRWSKKSAVWTHHWRNLHTTEFPEIQVEVCEEGRGPFTAGVTWQDDGDLNNRQAWIQRTGEKRQDPATLGWERPLELHRPILSYDELGGLLEAGPSVLFDKINPLLGIEQASDVEKFLADRVRELNQHEKPAKDKAKELEGELSGLDDDRARAALAELRKRQPDPDRVWEIVSGTAHDVGDDLTGLRAAVRLHGPARQQVAQALTELRSAADAYAEATVGVADLAERRATLLQEALDFHAEAGPGACPVCGIGHLDSQWHERVQAELRQSQEQQKNRNRAQGELNESRKQAEHLVHTTPEPPDPGILEVAEYALARDAWKKWTDIPSGARELADHMECHLDDVCDAYELLRDKCRDLLSKHEDAWRSHAAKLSEWVQVARQARDSKPEVKRAEAARAFMRRVIDDLRGERLEELASSARKIWAALKQESNVNLGGIQLIGTGTKRRVDLHADVDGSEAQALGVMSQGELHALALALFLPRATLPGSPFGFVVLDDPIQAMDPAKVDSFAKVLRDVASTRQVVVFSHDDRLPQAIHDLNISATVLQVVRDSESAVTITPCDNPSRRNISDARALCRDKNVPDDIRMRIVPVLCRNAVESAAREVFRSRKFAEGLARDDIESAWNEAQRTRQRIALAVSGDKGDRLEKWSKSKPWRRLAIDVVTKHLHTTQASDLKRSIDDVEKLVNDILGGR